MKFKTSKKNLYGKSVIVNGKPVNVDKDGVAEVEESLAVFCNLMGFTSLDPNAKFESLDEKVKAEATSSIIDAANRQKEVILEQARLEAKKILEDAQKQKAIQESIEKEKEEVFKKLNAMTVPMLKEKLAEMGVDKSEYDDKNKAELVDFIFTKAYSE